MNRVNIKFNGSLEGVEIPLSIKDILDIDKKSYGNFIPRIIEIDFNLDRPYLVFEDYYGEPIFNMFNTYISEEKILNWYYQLKNELNQLRVLGMEKKLYIAPERILYNKRRNCLVYDIVGIWGNKLDDKVKKYMNIGSYDYFLKYQSDMRIKEETGHYYRDEVKKIFIGLLNDEIIKYSYELQNNLLL